MADNPTYVKLLESVSEALHPSEGAHEEGIEPDVQRVMDAIWDEIDKFRYKADSAVSALQALGVVVAAEDDHFEVFVPQDLLDVINAR